MTRPQSLRRTWLLVAVSAVVAAAALVASVLLVGPGTPPAPGPGPVPGQGETPPGPHPMGPPHRTMTVTVYFHRGEPDDPGWVVPVERTVARSRAVATAALTQLLGGPTAQERADGYQSPFGPATAGSLIGVLVNNGVAHADFRDFRTVIPGASTSYGGTALLAELDATLGQFPTVTSTLYSFEGDVAAFYDWLQLAPPGSADRDAAAAVTTATRFLTTVAGMRRPTDGTFRATGEGNAEVSFPARSPQGRPLPDLATTVSLRRKGTGWVATASTTPTIVVDTPAAGQAVTSPVELRGRSVAFEGTVSVRMVAAQAGGPTEVGAGFVTGGSTEPGAFSGRVDVEPTDADAGWVVLFEESAADGSVVCATAVPITFAGASGEPAIEQVSWEPALDLDGGWLRLPDGAGTVTFTVQATATDRVEVVLTPTGTETAPLATVLAAATRTGAGFVLAWNYPDEPQVAHLTFVATGPGGRTEHQPFNVYHD